LAFPTFVIGCALTVAGWARGAHQSRRGVKLTVHRAFAVTPVVSDGETTYSVESDNYYITITNASRDRDIVVTHVWVETTPPGAGDRQRLAQAPPVPRAVGDIRAGLADPGRHD
jgi:hypothetical protein